MAGIEAEGEQPAGADRAGRRNLAILFAVSIFIGIGGAIYEVILPLFLKREGFSWQKMGWIYSLAALLTLLMRVAMGAWSDRVGRKKIYTGALVATGAAVLLTPFWNGVWLQALWKSVTDPASRVREAMHSVLLFEAWPRKFQRLFGRTRGVELLFHALGLIAAGLLLGWLARRGIASGQDVLLVGAGVLFLVSALFFGWLYHEERRVPLPDQPALSWRSFLRVDLTRPMWVLTISIFVFNLGVTLSHCFVLQLFFQEKYGATDAQIFTIGALHRVFPALTLFFLGHLFLTRQRMWLMLFLVLEGLFLALPGFLPASTRYGVAGVALPALWTVVVLWLGHDLLGMGLWLPIQQALLQKHSRSESRGEDLSLSTALAALGGVPAPFLAGWMRTLPGVSPETALNLPFIVSGIGVALSAAVLLWLPRD